MADRAKSDEGSPESIVDLVNDDRWQARLEKARARREVALREKGKDPESAPKRKPMPWEKELGATAKSDIDPIIQAPDSDRVDFADRVDRVRDTVAKEDATPDVTPDIAPLPPTEVSRSVPRSAPVTSFDELLTDDAFGEEEEVNWAPPPKKQHSAISESAPDVIELASRYASTLAPTLASNDGVADVFENTEPVVAATAAPKVKIHPPALMVLGVVFLAALPFTKTVPPLERGPAMPVEPSLRLEPALGFTTAMLWRPAETASSDWTPTSNWSLPLATIYSPKAPVLATRPATLEVPSVDQESLAIVTPKARSAARRSPQPPALDGADVDRLPGAFSRRPAARPLEGEPFASTQAPRRMPDVVTGNDTSPRIAPISDPDSTLLDQVTTLTNVMFDRAPDIADEALDALARAQAAVAPALSGPETVLQLTVLVPSKGDTQVANQFAADAAARGHTIASVKTVNISIKNRNVRYYFESDRTEAERLAAAYDATARDFTWFKPKPSAGTVELWLEGSAPAPRAPRIVRAAPQPVAPAPAPAPKVVVVRKQEGLLSRLFGGHKVGSSTVGNIGGSSGSVQVVTQQAPNTGGGTDTSGGTDTGGGTDTTGTGTGTGTTDTGTDTGTGTTGTGTDTGSGTGTDTGTGTGTDTGTDTGTGTDTSGGTDTSSGTDTSGGGTGSGGTSGGTDTGSTGSGSSGGAGTGSSGGGSTDSGSSDSGSSSGGSSSGGSGGGSSSGGDSGSSEP